MPSPAGGVPNPVVTLPKSCVPRRFVLSYTKVWTILRIGLTQY